MEWQGHSDQAPSINSTQHPGTAFVPWKKEFSTSQPRGLGSRPQHQVTGVKMRNADALLLLAGKACDYELEKREPRVRGCCSLPWSFHLTNLGVGKGGAGLVQIPQAFMSFYTFFVHLPKQMFLHRLFCLRTIFRSFKLLP